MSDTELCRSCLKDCHGSFTLNRPVSLSPTKSSDFIEISFNEVFNSITDLEACETDQLTPYFCNDCYDNILKAYQTIKTAQESHRLLMRVVNSIKGPANDDPVSQEPYVSIPLSKYLSFIFIAVAQPFRTVQNAF